MLIAIFNLYTIKISWGLSNSNSQDKITTPKTAPTTSARPSSNVWGPKVAAWKYVHKPSNSLWKEAKPQNVQRGMKLLINELRVPSSCNRSTWLPNSLKLMILIVAWIERFIIYSTMMLSLLRPHSRRVVEGFKTLTLRPLLKIRKRKWVENYQIVARVER